MSDDDLLFTALAVGGLLVLAAFFSAAETGLTGVSRAMVHRLKTEGNRRARIISRLHEDKDRLIAAILLGNNVVNILGSAVATAFCIRAFGDDGLAYATVIMTVLITIFSEVLPKAYAFRKSEKVALFVAPVMSVVVKILTPFTIMVEMIVDGLLRMLGVQSSEDSAGDVMEASEELRGAIDLHHSEGAVVKNDRDMLGGILDLSEMAVADIMVHRKNMVRLDISLKPESVMQQVLNTPYSRLPVWKDNPDNIVGLLHVKTYLKQLQQAVQCQGTVDINDVLTKPWFVPATTSLKEQLQAFLVKHQHAAFVVDEYGALLGMITLEDILEEIVGQIDDEHDTVRGTQRLKREADGSCIVDGTMAIRDLNRDMEWGIPDEEASTLAGLIIYEAERIPDSGEAFQFHGYRFEVIEKQRHQISRVKVSRVLGDEDEGSDV